MFGARGYQTEQHTAQPKQNPFSLKSARKWSEKLEKTRSSTFTVSTSDDLYVRPEMVLWGFPQFPNSQIMSGTITIASHFPIAPQLWGLGFGGSWDVIGN